MEPKRSRHATSLLVGLLVLLAAAACSSGSGGSSSTAASTGASTTSAPDQLSHPDSGSTAGPFALTSPAFADGGAIPKANSCDGAGTQPALRWSGVPAGTKSLTLVVFDPDAGSDGFVHWIIGGLDPAAGMLAAGTVPAGAVQADNGAGQPKWTAPCPPSGRHHYVFTLYALDGPTSITPGEDASQAIAATKGEARSSTTLTGLYERS